MFCWSANDGSLTITFSLSLFSTMLDCKRNKTNSFSSRVYKTKDEYAKINFFVYSKRDERRWITVNTHDFLSENKFTLQIKIGKKDSSSKCKVKLFRSVHFCLVQPPLTEHFWIFPIIKLTNLDQKDSCFIYRNI